MRSLSKIIIKGDWAILHKRYDEYRLQYTGYYEPTMTGYSDSFDKYVEHNFGIKFKILDDGYIDPEFVVTNEGKYAWFILKYK